MFVRNVMIPLDKVTHVQPDDTVAQAYAIARNTKFTALPVIDGTRLIGAVATHDLLELVEQHQADQHKVAELVVPTGKAVLPGDVIEAAAQNLRGRAINFLPVENDRGVLLGIVTRDGLFSEMCRLFGCDANNVRITLLVRDQKGQLERLAHAITDEGGNISHIATRQSDTHGHYLLVVRVDIPDPHPLLRRLEQVGYQVLEVFDERVA